MRSSKLPESNRGNPLCWNDCKETSYHIYSRCDPSTNNQSGNAEKIRIVISMFEIIGNESCPQQIQTLPEKSSISWTHCFRQRNPTSCQKDPRHEKFEEPWKQERHNARLRKLRFLQYNDKEFTGRLKTFLWSPEDDVPFKWTKDHEIFFRDTKNRISEEDILALPNPKYPFHIHVDSSSIGIGSMLVQEFPSGKRIVSFSSRAFTKDEQKMSTLYSELCGIRSARHTYEHLIIGSRHPIKNLLWSHCCTCGREKKIVSPFLPIPSDQYSVR